MNSRNISAGDLMQQNVQCVNEATSIVDAALLMSKHHVSSLVVQKEDDKDALGIITRKDIVESVTSEVHGGNTLSVGDVMTKPVITVAPDLSIFHCLRLMRMAGVRRLVVTKDGALAGILSNTDIFRKIVADLQAQ